MHRFFRSILLPPGPILSVTLVGLIVLSGLLYYRAVKIQRFMEPALALSQPRNEFAQTISDLLGREFGPEGMQGIKFMGGSIFIEESVLFENGHKLKEGASYIFRKIGNVFRSALKDEVTRSHIDLILVISRFPQSYDPLINRNTRLVQYRAELILDEIFRQVPELEHEYGVYFAATYIPHSPEEKGNMLQISIIPSEQLHIEVLQRLKKYAQ